MVSCLFFAACKNFNDNNWGFWIEVIEEGASAPLQKKYISAKTIRNFPVDSIITTAKDKSENLWTGANLCNLFATELNIFCDQIKKIAISADDGYSSVLFDESLSHLKSGACVYQNRNNQKWLKEYGAFRIIFPELRAMYWVNDPRKITITLKTDSLIENRFYFYFPEYLDQLNLINDEKISIENLLKSLEAKNLKFAIVAGDSLFREYIENSINQRMILEKEKGGTWKITGFKIPLGLKTTQIFCLIAGKKTVFLKELNKKEQQVWRDLFWKRTLLKWQSLKDLKVEVVLHYGEKYVSSLTKDYLSNRISLYELFQQERNSQQNIDCLIVSW